MSLERTLVMLKPDATRRHLTGKINARFEKSGLRIIAQKRLILTPRQAEQFYAVHADKPFFHDLCRSITQGPVVAQILEGENAIQRTRVLLGSTDPSKAEPGTLRAVFGESIEANTVHSSDGTQTAPIEIAFFFSTLEIVG